MTRKLGRILIAVATSLGVIAVAAILFVNLRPLSFRNHPTASSVERTSAGDSNTVQPKRAPASPPAEQGSTEAEASSSERSVVANADSASVRIEREFEAVFTGGIQIDDFIRRHLAAAQSGNASSMYYVAEAMGFCHVDLMEFQSQVEWTYRDHAQPPAPRTRGDWDRQREAIMNGLAHAPDYFRAQTLSRIRRAEQCTSLGRDAAQFRQEHLEWHAAALAANQPTARARAASEGLEARPPEGLQRSKETMRDVLRTNRQLEPLLYAAQISIYVTGRDAASERLAWALLACEYYDCEATFNHLYRVGCEVASLRGEGDYCSAEMSDMDYLLGKYPGQFDVARGRATEIREAIDSARWEVLGLN
jgi:hypothetical protein